ncbi:MAG: sugar ABC transporter permease [Puniceicoccales bacterium]|jgi:multiple sugar transport system permease protein|nr:sugar ABC transporter permease [Puniceicoccales bacterium]
MQPIKKRGLSDAQIGIVLILPALAVFATIILYPFINSIFMSFTNRSMLKPEADIVGFANYIKVFSDPYFLGTILNTAILVVGSTLIPFTLGFIWAVVLNQKFRGSEFIRGVTLVNWIIPGTAIGFLWLWIFNGEYGILNGLLSSLGLIDKNIPWLSQRGTAMFVVIIARTWQMLPWYMAFLMGGLQGVSYDQIEAARIDGANNWQVFRHVVLPSMSTLIGTILILGTIGSLQHFDLPWVMTEGGPARATTTLSIEVYRTAFKNWDLGRAATVGTIWAILLAVFSFVYLRKVNDSE